MASCLFLMIYLPPASWWRFVGWLALGLAFYSSYGYCHSALGREGGRPHKPPPVLKVLSGGLLATSIGLFGMPHGVGLRGLVDALMAGELRAVLGIGLTALGMSITLVALAVARRSLASR